jgi:hypothetical protein
LIPSIESGAFSHKGDQSNKEKSQQDPDRAGSPTAEHRGGL